MPRIIEVTVSPRGESTVQTKGYTGGDCLAASRFLEQALGVSTGEPQDRRVPPGSARRPGRRSSRSDPALTSPRARGAVPCPTPTSRPAALALVERIAGAIRHELGAEVDAYPGLRDPDRADPLNRAFRAVVRSLLSGPACLRST